MSERPRTPARRLAPEQRREQLVRAAMRVLASDGLEGVSFEAVARHADVTRNLLYHYFPGGVPELRAAAADLAGHDLIAGWVTDEAVPLEERRAQNFAAMLAHAAAPSDAWAVSRVTSVSTDPAIRALNAHHRGRVVEAVAANAFGAPPSPLQRAALEAYLAFAEHLLDAARERGLDRGDVVRTLTVMLEQTVATTR